MFWPFRRKNHADPAADVPRLTLRIAALEARCAALEDRASEEQAKAFAFRGRVYAYLGRKGVKLAAEDAPEPAEKPFDWQTCELSDPRLTRAQVKMRLNLTTPAGIARHLRN